MSLNDLSITITAQNLASSEFAQVASDAGAMAAQISPVQAGFNDVGVAATEMGANVEAAGSSFDDLGTQAEATSVKLTTVARGISSVSSLGLGITTLGVDFAGLNSQQTKYIRDALAVVTVVAEVARMMNYATLFTSGHTASVTIDSSAQVVNAASTVTVTAATEGQAAATAVNTTTTIASTVSNIASTVAMNIKSAATWIAVAAENALNISQATFLALTGVGIAVIAAAAIAMWAFAGSMNAATSSVHSFNNASASLPSSASSGVSKASLIRSGVEALG